MKLLGHIALFLCLSFILGTFYLIAIDANPPVSIESVPSISPDRVYPGELVTVSTDYCKRTDVDASLNAFWRRESDGLVWEFTQRVTNVGVKGCGTLILPLNIPSDIPPGEWQRVNVATYKVNLLVSRTEQWESDYVTVLEKDG